jgi:hypothetical protein
MEPDPMASFVYALKAAETQRQYPRRFQTFLDFLGYKGTLPDQAKLFLTNARKNAQWAEAELMRFITFQRKRVESREIVGSTIRNYIKATKLFCQMNDLVLNWDKVRRGLPSARQSANDRAPTLEEIKRLVEYPDRRIKPIIYTMVSSGMRIGSWDYLRCKHVAPLFENGKLIAAKLLVYAGDPEEYPSFITPEAYNSLNDWMKFRSSYGEVITGDSCLMRDIWQTTNITYGAKLGLATVPKILKSSGIRRLLERALWEQGLRHPLVNGARRHEWKAAHGFRKFFKTQAERTMKSLNVEILMGHNIGLADSYYKPSEQELLKEYLLAVDMLTIHDKTKHEKQLEELKDKSTDNENVIEGRLREKDVQIQALIKKQEKFELMIQSLIDSGQLKRA